VFLNNVVHETHSNERLERCIHPFFGIPSPLPKWDTDHRTRYCTKRDFLRAVSIAGSMAGTDELSYTDVHLFYTSGYISVQTFWRGFGYELNHKENTGHFQHPLLQPSRIDYSVRL
jgi:hypothetical protein